MHTLNHICNIYYIISYWIFILVWTVFCFFFLVHLLCFLVQQIHNLIIPWSHYCFKCDRSFTSELFKTSYGYFWIYFYWSWPLKIIISLICVSAISICSIFIQKTPKMSKIQQVQKHQIHTNWYYSIYESNRSPKTIQIVRN